MASIKSVRTLVSDPALLDSEISQAISDARQVVELRGDETDDIAIRYYAAHLLTASGKVGILQTVSRDGVGLTYKEGDSYNKNQFLDFYHQLRPMYVGSVI